jgi:hypothetical protein
MLPALDQSMGTKRLGISYGLDRLIGRFGSEISVGFGSSDGMDVGVAAVVGKDVIGISLTKQC